MIKWTILIRENQHITSKCVFISLLALAAVLADTSILNKTLNIELGFPYMKRFSSYLNMHFNSKSQCCDNLTTPNSLGSFCIYLQQAICAQMWLNLHITQNLNSDHKFYLHISTCKFHLLHSQANYSACWGRIHCYNTDQECSFTLNLIQSNCGLRS